MQHSTTQHKTEDRHLLREMSSFWILNIFLFLLKVYIDKLSQLTFIFSLLCVCVCVCAGSPERGWPELPAGVLAPPGVSRRIANTEKTRLWSYSPGIYIPHHMLSEREGGRAGRRKGGKEGGKESRERDGRKAIVMFPSLLFSKVQWVPQSLLYLLHLPHRHRIASTRFGRNYISS